MNEPEYSAEFYSAVAESADQSAEIVVPLILDLVKAKRVADVGCGSGAWLRKFQEHGCEIQGFDGPWVKEEQLLIPRANFTRTDLASFSHSGNGFDLVISLEVAEHLPSSSSDQFVRALTTMAPAVVFSAAIPGQGGDFHMNEQWQSYWIAKFAHHRYECYDVLRPKLWNDDRVAVHYVQNVFLFVRAEYITQMDGGLARYGIDQRLTDVVHPRVFRDKTSPLNYSIKKFIFVFLPAYIRYLFRGKR